MVVSVKPLGHLHGMNAAMVAIMVLVAGAFVLGSASRHHEIGRKVDLRPLPADAFGHRTHHRAGVEDVIVKAKVVRRNQIDAGCLLLLPVSPAQIGSGLLQPGFGFLAAPIGFK